MDLHSPNSDARDLQIETMVEYIENETFRLRSLLFSGKVPSSRVKNFAFDLALIGLSVRAGHLVDAFAPKDARKGFPALLHSLQQRFKLFEDVVHVYEPASEQSFLINVPLLSQRYPAHAFVDSSCWPFSYPIFVSTEGSSNVLPEPPEALSTLLQDLTNQLLNPSEWKVTSTIELPQGLSASSTVPLAALLLEYPVAYCPPATVTSPFLSSEMLDVYDVCLELPNNEGYVLTFSDGLNRRHSMLKFSCPLHLGAIYPERLSPEDEQTCACRNCSSQYRNGG
ncbi:hypothetical protein GYMLUDRAFT_265601 [Collybiopsis luxurians FD-317 M1]|uniref:Uncharacterized protein n=1 Tax=Collybiopsis luxurians FD-317 M1 TaxID=944289 RepID=A0A0D0BR20_9AGAR|nr:hypothetical protein GYMLUDRAFT_265601 [Collybiopsis luxurians FD-317 M1]